MEGGVGPAAVLQVPPLGLALVLGRHPFAHRLVQTGEEGGPAQPAFLAAAANFLTTQVGTLNQNEIISCQIGGKPHY